MPAQAAGAKPSAASDMSSPSGRLLYFRLLQYVKPYRGRFAGGLLALAVVAATEPAMPALMQPMLDGTFVDKDPLLMTWIPALIVGLFLVRGIAGYISDYAVAWIGTRVVLDLRVEMFERLLTLPTPYFDNAASGNLMSKVSFDVANVMTAATNALTTVVKESLVVIGLIAWLMWLSWKLTLIVLVVAPLVAFIIRTVARRLRGASRGAQAAMGEMNRTLDEAIGGHRVIKVYGGQAYETARFGHTANEVRRFLLRQAGTAAAGMPVVQLVTATAVATVIWIATEQAKAGELSVGSFVSYMVAMLMVMPPLRRLTGVTEHLQRGLAAAESIFELIDQPPEADPGRTRLMRAGGAISMRGVSFRYSEGGREALAGIDLDIAPGEMVALVGASGSGKTTLANLLPRFYRVDAGSVRIDGIELADLPLADLRQQIALVSQDVVLFNDTVAANIAYGGRRDASRAEIEAAADAAFASGFIGEMDRGFDTLIGENGVRLSGGQRQRLAIARAILKDAPILILDEATSALDSESEQQVQAALERLMQGRTTLVIAHRLSTIEKADRIIVMESGHIVESGHHDELLRKGGTYARLHASQFKENGVREGRPETSVSDTSAERD
jgi:subfamily B ATP-binding cassette protein MsbA